MGCDIHPHIEVKIDNTWHHYSCPPIQRCYGLFAKICGVRNQDQWGIGPLAPVRGLPNDCSAVTKVCAEHEEGHSHTWLSHKEFLELIEWADNPENIVQSWHGEWSHKQLGYLTGNSFDLQKSSAPEQITDVRFICWFDN